jgi:hypothetical protein
MTPRAPSAIADPQTGLTTGGTVLDHSLQTSPDCLQVRDW